MVPYVPESTMATDGRKLPQALNETNWEVRPFMPRWGIINERRNQLHEVIRLSGMNIIIDDTDHPLIIKVASIQAARMQVYFIDNDDYFHKRGMLADDKGKEYIDNVERAIFYARGVLETVKKLRWPHDIVFCQGWMSAIAPYYIKTAYRDDPSFAEAKIVSAVYGQSPTLANCPRFAECLNFRTANEKALQQAGVDLSQLTSLEQLGVAFSDGVIEGEAGACADLLNFANERQLPTLAAPAAEERAAAYSEFFNSLLV